MVRRKHKRVVKITNESPAKSVPEKKEEERSGFNQNGNNDNGKANVVRDNHVTFNKSVKYKSPSPLYETGDTDSEAEPPENVNEIDWKYSFTTTSEIDKEDTFKTHCTIRSVLQSDNFSFSFNSLTIFPDSYTINLQELDDSGGEVLKKDQILNKISDDILVTIHSSLKDYLKNKEMDSVRNAAYSVYSYLLRKRKPDPEPDVAAPAQANAEEVKTDTEENMLSVPTEEMAVQLDEEVNNNTYKQETDNPVVSLLKAAAAAASTSTFSSSSPPDPYPLFLHAVQSFQHKKFIGLKSYMSPIEELYQEILEYLTAHLPNEVEAFTKHASKTIEEMQKARVEQIQKEIQKLLKESTEEFWNDLLVTLVYSDYTSCNDVEKVFQTTLSKVLKKLWKKYAILCEEFKSVFTKELVHNLEHYKSVILKYYISKWDGLGIKIAKETKVDTAGTHINIILFGETEKVIWHWTNSFYNYLKNSSSVKSLDSLDLEMILAPGNKESSLQSKPLEFTIRSRPNSPSTTYRFFIVPCLEAKKGSVPAVKTFQIQDYLASLNELEFIHGICILLEAESKFSFGHEYYLHQILSHLPKVGKVTGVHLCLTTIGNKQNATKDHKLNRTIATLSNLLPGFDRKVQILTFDLLILPRFLVYKNHLPFEKVIEKVNPILWNNSALLGETLGSAWYRSTYSQPFARYSNIWGLNVAQKMVRSVFLAQSKIEEKVRKLQSENASMEQRRDLMGAETMVKKITRELCYFIYKTSITGGTCLELEQRYINYLEYKGSEDSDSIGTIKKFYDVETKEMNESKKSNVLLLKIDSLESKKGELFGIQWFGKIIEQYYFSM